jgi:hypothetical protein
MKLVGAEVHGRAFLLTLGDAIAGEHIVRVQPGRHGRRVFSFVNFHSDETTGDPELDEKLLDAAGSVVAYLDAAREWARFTWGAGS